MEIEELVGNDIAQVFSELFDHRMDWLGCVCLKVQVPSCILSHHRFPIWCQRVSQSKHAIPVVRRSLLDAQLCCHILPLSDRIGNLQGHFASESQNLTTPSSKCESQRITACFTHTAQSKLNKNSKQAN